MELLSKIIYAIEKNHDFLDCFDEEESDKMYNFIMKLPELIKNNSILDDAIKCDCKLEKHERAKMELDYNKCMDCKKPIE